MLRSARKRVRTRILARQDSRYASAFSGLLNGNSLSLIDVGAAGEIQPRWLRVASSLSYTGFEPDSRSREQLVESEQGCASYTIVQSVLAAQTNDIQLNLCRKPTVSSTLMPNFDLMKRFPDVERFDVLEEILVPATTLDALELPCADFIKLDVQGGELAVLQGAPLTLNRCLGVEVEVEFARVYSDQPLFGDIQTYLEEAGLIFMDFVTLNRWGRSTYDGYGQAVFGDALFLRAPEYFSENTVEVSRQIRWVAVCALYNRFDLIERFLEIRAGPPLPEKVLSSVAMLRLRFDKARRYTARARRVAAHSIGAEFSLHLFC